MCLSPAARGDPITKDFPLGRASTKKSELNLTHRSNVLAPARTNVLASAFLRALIWLVPDIVLAPPTQREQCFICRG
ncbi:MAG: hypothetical protein UX25_C0050G0004 [Candidatus Woesebacteria bacterium GW2011_GWC2_45_9]|uniref:Uncharacterized protein n=1 Tax=Candidatus Woesebacteria bacterium GW2011_GWC2_45_9 TaxID=1618589 RepID=A0A0G1N5R0_9BACT|nr:MAG: hypothetical protein UX25_C0050G0004 [Candidatus Woesebacteria bacterium GW2011_GWC2_45_9]